MTEHTPCREFTFWGTFHSYLIPLADGTIDRSRCSLGWRNEASEDWQALAARLDAMPGLVIFVDRNDFCFVRNTEAPCSPVDMRVFHVTGIDIPAEAHLRWLDCGTMEFRDKKDAPSWAGTDGFVPAALVPGLAEVAPAGSA